ncbi:hypothetical protein F4804DRAFT_332025 [Jackrogersella minutella]|nr:hypothetical protein F4804DRAFT_332025 [Jackrogersella minutella]
MDNLPAGLSDLAFLEIHWWQYSNEFYHLFFYQRTPQACEGSLSKRIMLHHSTPSPSDLSLAGLPPDTELQIPTIRVCVPEGFGQGTEKLFPGLEQRCADYGEAVRHALALSCRAVPYMHYFRVEVCTSRGAALADVPPSVVLLPVPSHRIHVHWRPGCQEALGRILEDPVAEWQRQKEPGYVLFEGCGGCSLWEQGQMHGFLTEMQQCDGRPTLST